MPRNAFHSARLKVERAERHINELQATLRAFLQTDFYRIWLDADSQPGSYIVRYDTEPLPAQVPLIIGDVIHNLWTAFDHIASEIARSIGKDGDRVHFPKDETRDRVAKSERLALIVQAAPDLKEVILDQICPYKGGRFALWETGKLDNIDKHKLLVPTIAITGLAGISALDDNGNGIVGMTATVDAGGRMNIAGFGVPARVTNYGQPTFKVAFSQGSYFDGEPIIPTLVQLTQFFKEAIGLIESVYFESKSP